MRLDLDLDVVFFFFDGVESNDVLMDTFLLLSLFDAVAVDDLRCGRSFRTGPFRAAFRVVRAG